MFYTLSTGDRAFLIGGLYEMQFFVPAVDRFCDAETLWSDHLELVVGMPSADRSYRGVRRNLIGSTDQR